ncbi:MAG: DSD1 family PLP-dependent enzyme [Candidatus Abyssobacteria bacterium SURF_17]|uniref:DSD1 family PLP-dependent enzyme n=1 Tax=Candidatus Abyssobacteria bacterium SURF_17 TaxID=2093361 RepID=A0A419FA49_9BACT|nr:MAG: DSD1 family PLP-dependent enzyme [Candidatus Abyssubacteria bacterium SURF_17]
MHTLSKYEIDTPALVIDLDKMDRNIRKMADFFEKHSSNLRPHTKTHKCPILAHKQLQAGARGITCAKLGEAEVMALAGIRDILIANQIVGAQKTARLANLARHCDVMVAVESTDNVAELSSAAGSAGSTIRVLIEVDVGMHRCGVKSAEEALSLAQIILSSPGLEFEGIMGYEGHAVMIPDFEDRQRACIDSMQVLISTKEILEKNGIEVKIVSAGGTGTYNIAGTYPGITEIQGGSYILMDAHYAGVLQDFECALTILTTIISRPNKETAILDAGMKAMTFEFGMPELVGLPGANLSFLSEEHGHVYIEDVDPKAGQKIEVIPSHCCTTINLHDIYYAVRGDRVEGVWPIAARGKFV